MQTQHNADVFAGACAYVDIVEVVGSSPISSILKPLSGNRLRHQEKWCKRRKQSGVNSGVKRDFRTSEEPLKILGGSFFVFDSMICGSSC